nr:hypothetical protein [Tanacetum cinerariifolium]
MTGNKAYLADYQKINDGGFVAFGLSKGKITGKGKIRTKKLDFDDVYFVNELQFNLFSVSQMCDKKNSLLFSKTECLVLSPNFKLLDESQVLLRIPKQSNMYSFDLQNVVSFGDLTCLFAKAFIDESNLWHMRLGHVNFKTTNKLVKGNLVRGLPSKIFENDHTCVACQKGKQHKANSRTRLGDSLLPITFWAVAVNTGCYVLNRALMTKSHNKTLYELLNGRTHRLDFMRPFECPVTILNTLDPLGKFKGKVDEGFLVGYSVTSKAFRVFNTKTKKVKENLHVRFLKNKPNVAGTGPNWLFDIDSLTNSINYIPVSAGYQTDKNAGPQDTNVNAGTQDNVGLGKEVSDQHYIMLPLWYSISSIFKSSDDKAVDDKPKDDTANTLRKESKQGCMDQRGTNKAGNTNPVNTVSNPVNAVSTLGTFSAGGPSSTYPDAFIPAHALLHINQDDSQIPDLEDTAELQNTGIFNSAYDDDLDIFTSPVQSVGAEANFNNMKSSTIVSPIPTHRVHLDRPKDQILEDLKLAVQTRGMTKKSSRAHALVSYIHKQRRTNYKDYDNYLFVCFHSHIVPKNVTQSLNDESWVEAMQEELLQFSLQKVWRLVDLPYGKKAIGTKWVYINKKDKRDIVVRNKAMPEVYVSQPPGFIDLRLPNKVYKVEKALYGLHQAPRAWYETSSTFLIQNRYRKGTIDKTLVIKKDKDGIMLVQVYVDDIIFGSTKKSLCDKFEALMHKRFQMSSMRELTFFLGLQVKRSEERIFISQNKYVAKILKKFDFSSLKTTSTPIETQNPLVKDEGVAYVDVHLYRSMIRSLPLVKDEGVVDVDVHLYKSMIRSLMYLTASRPDITFAVCACSRFQVTPNLSHLHASKRIFRYLKCQPKLGLWYLKDSSFNLEAYSDSDYAGVNLDRKSTTGGCQFLGRRLISWHCKKQTIVAPSTTEAEIPVNDAKPKAAASTSAAKSVNTTGPKQSVNFSKSRSSVVKGNGVTAVKTSAGCVWRPRGHPQQALKNKGIVDSVCSRHMTGNKAYHADLLTKAFDVKTFSSINLYMADLKFVDQRNMVACLERIEENTEFHQIVDFLSICLISYALTVSPTIYASYIEQFWNTATSKTVNSVKQIHAIVDGKVVVILESSVRSDLLFNDEDESHINQILPSPSTYQRKHRKTYKHRRAKKVIELPQTSVPLDLEADKAIHKEGVTVWKGLSLVITRRQETTLRGVDTQTRFETASKKSRDPPLSEVNKSRSGEDIMERPDDLMDFEEAKTTQDKVITRLKLRVRRLENKRKAMTSQPMKRRLFKGRVETSTDKILGEDASKQKRNDDKTEELNLTDGVDTEVIVEDKGSGEKGGSTADQVSAARPEVSAASVPVNVCVATPSTPPTTTTIFGDKDLSIAQTLIKLRNEKAKEKGVAFRDVEEPPRLTRSTTTLQPLSTINPKDKDLAQRIYEEELVELDRAQKEKQKQEEATIAALTEELDEIQARMDADHELAIQHSNINPQKMMQEQESAKSDEEESADYKHEKVELRMWLIVVLDEEEIMDLEILSTNMLRKFDRQDLVDLPRLVIKIFKDNTPEGYNLLLLGDLKYFELLQRVSSEKVSSHQGNVGEDVELEARS